MEADGDGDGEQLVPCPSQEAQEANPGSAITSPPPAVKFHIILVLPSLPPHGRLLLPGSP